MEQTVNPGTEARAEGAATLTQADLDRVVQQTIARERRRAEAALEAARAEAGRAERERLEAGMAPHRHLRPRRGLSGPRARGGGAGEMTEGRRGREGRGGAARVRRAYTARAAVVRLCDAGGACEAGALCVSSERVCGARVERGRRLCGCASARARRGYHPRHPPMRPSRPG